MKITTTATVLALGLVAACTEEPNLGNTSDMFTHTRWAITVGGEHDDDARSVAIDLSGDVVAAGNFKGTVDFGNEALSATQGAGWLSKRSGVDGSDLWTVALGSEPSALASAADVAVAADGSVIVAGELSGEMTLGQQILEALPLAVTDYDFVAKYDTAGQLQWARTIAATGPGAFTSNAAVAVGRDGRIALVGSYGGTIEFPNGSFTSIDHDAFLVVLDGTGQMIWGKTSPALSASTVAMTSEDDVVIAGELSATAMLDGVTLQPDARISPYRARFTVDGTLLWANVQVSDGHEEEAGPIALDVTDSVVTTATKHVTEPIENNGLPEIDSLDPNGQPVWSNDAVSGSALADSVTVMANGTVVTGGGTMGFPIDFGSGTLKGCMYLAAHDHDGSLVDAIIYPSARASCSWIPWKLASTPTGAIAYAGVVDGPADLGTGTLRFAGETDAMIVMLDTPAAH